jgi:hypothetical protein
MNEGRGLVVTWLYHASDLVTTDPIDWARVVRVELRRYRRIPCSAG